MSQNSMRDQIKIIQQLANTQLCIDLASDDKGKYVDHMKTIFPEFSEKYMILFKKIIFREDLTMLEPMLKSLEELESGKITEKDITTNIGETLAEKYLYPVLGKPESTTEKNPQFVTK